MQMTAKWYHPGGTQGGTPLPAMNISYPWGLVANPP